MRRKYILLLRRFLQTKLQLGCCQSNTTRLTTGAVVAAPIVPNCLKLKAGTTTDFAHQLLLRTELSWQRKQTSKDKDIATKKLRRKSRRPSNDLSNGGRTLAQADDSTAADQCLATAAVATEPLPWNFPMKEAWPLYMEKNRAFAKGASSHIGHTHEPHATAEEFVIDGSSPAMRPGDQVSLQLKVALKGKPAPNLQLRVQKVLSNKMQLRAQLRTDFDAMRPLQSKWQLEARHKLAKGASASVKLVHDQQKSAHHGNSPRHSLQIEHKNRTNFVTCACRHQATGVHHFVDCNAFLISEDLMLLPNVIAEQTAVAIDFSSAHSYAKSPLLACCCRNRRCMHTLQHLQNFSELIHLSNILANHDVLGNTEQYLCYSGDPEN